VGVGRLFLALLFDAYFEDEVDGEPRIVLKLNPKIAPITAAILPLTNKLREQSEKLFFDLKKAGYRVQYDSSGSIGKRYRRQDEVGTPVCFTYDFESLEDDCVTARNRDTLAQERVSIGQLSTYLNKLLGR
jgi:glycyl-tRNA synthetase